MNISEYDTPHKYSSTDRRVLPVSLCVLHYTATPYYNGHSSGSNRKRIVNWVSGKTRKSSTHFVVLRDGDIIQAASLDERTWHSGGSKYTFPNGQKVKGINFRSIGLDFDNVGMLFPAGDNFIDYYEYTRCKRDCKIPTRFYKGPTPYRHVDASGKISYWEPYSRESIDSMKFILHQISKRVTQLTDDPWRLIKHSDIRSTKSDPGPACPIGELQNALLSDFDPEDLLLPRLLSC